MARGLPVTPERAVLRDPLRQGTTAVSNDANLASAAPRALTQGKASEGGPEVPPLAALLSCVDSKSRREAP